MIPYDIDPDLPDQDRVTLTEGVSIGQRKALSPSDIAAVRSIYPPQPEAEIGAAARATVT